MSRLQVSTSELVAVSGELDALAQTLRADLGSLDTDVAELQGGGWSGQAAAAYTGVWREWHDGAAAVAEGLSRMSSLLQEAAERYSSTDEASGDKVSGAGL